MNHEEQFKADLINLLNQEDSFYSDLMKDKTGKGGYQDRIVLQHSKYKLFIEITWDKEQQTFLTRFIEENQDNEDLKKEKLFDLANDEELGWVELYVEKIQVIGHELLIGAERFIARMEYDGTQPEWAENDDWYNEMDLMNLNQSDESEFAQNTKNYRNPGKYEYIDKRIIDDGDFELLEEFKTSMNNPDDKRWVDKIAEIFKTIQTIESPSTINLIVDALADLDDEENKD